MMAAVTRLLSRLRGRRERRLARELERRVRGELDDRLAAAARMVDDLRRS
jgi:hypothetical protein